MNVLVTGGTGFIGRHLCEELHERGHDVTALSRDPDPNVVPAGVDLVEGDVTDRDSLDEPFEGQDAVVNLVALSPLWKPEGGNEMHDRVHRQGTENQIDAAREADVGRFVQMSGLGIDADIDAAYFRAKARAEEIVRGSGLEHVIFRPSIAFGEGAEIVKFTTTLKRWFAPGLPIYPLPGGGERTYFQLIYAEELAPMLAAGAVEDEHANETYELGGPRVYTLRDVTELVFEAKGRRVRIVPIPMPIAKIGLGVMEVVPSIPLGLGQYEGLKADNRPTHNDVDAFGVSEDEMTTFEAYLGLE